VLPMTGLGGAAAGVAPYAEMGVEHSPATDGSGTPLGPQGAGANVSMDAREGVAGDDRGPLLIVSGAFLGAGGVLLGARAIARRRDPVR
jgi:hypothetical protein